MENDEGFEGVEFQTPVGSFRAGRGRGDWSEAGVEFNDDYRRARRRVRRVLGFWRHLATFVSIGLVLLAVDLIFDPDEFFVQWVALIWGIILALHFLNVFAFDAILGKEAEKRMIERELRRRQSSGEER